MSTAPASNREVTSPDTPEPAADPGFIQARLVAPIRNLLLVGASPQRLAWSLAAGAVIGINPIIGSTTVIALLVALVFRLNLVASQLTNHLCFPLQLALTLVYLRAGQALFRTGDPPIPAGEIIHAMRLRPWFTMHMLWTWEWHAIVVWLIAAFFLTPLLAALFHPPLDRLLASILAKQERLTPSGKPV